MEVTCLTFGWPENILQSIFILSLTKNAERRIDLARWPNRQFSYVKLKFHLNFIHLFFGINFMSQYSNFPMSPMKI